MKDLYIEIVEELMNAEDISYEQASEKAYDVMIDRFADYADRAKDLWKDRGL